MNDEERGQITERLRRKGEEGGRRFRDQHPDIVERTRGELDRRAAELGYRSFDVWVAGLREQMEQAGRR